MNAISDSAKEPDHSSRLWSRELKSDTSTRPPRGREAVRINSDCGGLLIKLPMGYQYSSPNTVPKPALHWTSTLTIAVRSNFIFQSSMKQKTRVKSHFRCEFATGPLSGSEDSIRTPSPHEYSPKQWDLRHRWGDPADRGKPFTDRVHNPPKPPDGGPNILEYAEVLGPKDRSRNSSNP